MIGKETKSLKEDRNLDWNLKSSQNLKVYGWGESYQAVNSHNHILEMVAEHVRHKLRL
jgi:hypothetical protein